MLADAGTVCIVESNSAHCCSLPAEQAPSHPFRVAPPPGGVHCRYFCVDPDSKDGRLVFNRTVTLKESIAKDIAAVKQGVAAGGGPKK